MTVLSAAQKNSVVNDMRVLILSCGETATRSRPVKSTPGYGGVHTESNGNDVSLNITTKQLTAAELRDIGANLVVSCLTTADVEEGDQLTVASRKYEVTEKTPFNLFGVLTHYDLKLEILRAQ